MYELNSFHEAKCKWAVTIRFKKCFAIFGTKIQHLYLILHKTIIPMKPDETYLANCTTSTPSGYVVCVVLASA